jgi:oligopeptide/dipeptide ABC transporter ATP-binding protein
LDDVSLELHENTTLGVIGESGCGKSTLLRTIVGLQRPTRGDGQLAGLPLFSGRRQVQHLLHQRVQMVFQDPFGSLNPRRRIGATINTALSHRGAAPAARAGECEFLLQQVGLRPSHANCFPHQLSGGQRQRVAIARALAVQPVLLVLDEPTSALDVSVQAQVANLLQQLKQQQRLSYLLVAHDLGLVRQMSDAVIVMYAGKIVESGPSTAVLSSPLHPYTRALVTASAPPSLAGRGTRRPPLRNADVAAGSTTDSGCQFVSRCRFATAVCREVEPPLTAHAQRHFAACHRPGIAS